MFLTLACNVDLMSATLLFPTMIIVTVTGVRVIASTKNVTSSISNNNGIHLNGTNINNNNNNSSNGSSSDGGVFYPGMFWVKD